MKRYTKGVWRGEDTQFERQELKKGGRYTGEFLVFEDAPNYLGSVLFSVYGGRISAVCMKCYWDFKEKDAAPCGIIEA